jgi:YrbI family 3-deoxy-D-manno-octulosonate 8-phosphate phosphatase
VGSERIELIVTDVDGTLTDGGVYYSSDGSVSRRFSTTDGHGFEIARDSGVEVFILSKSKSPDIVYRAKHLGVQYWVGCTNKQSAIRYLANDRKIQYDSICYMGNDVPDMGAMDLCGYRACPADAHDYIKTMCAVTGFTSTYKGGHGAFRQLIDWLSLFNFEKTPFPINIKITGESS